LTPPSKNDVNVSPLHSPQCTMQLINWHTLHLTKNTTSGCSAKNHFFKMFRGRCVQNLLKIGPKLWSQSCPQMGTGQTHGHRWFYIPSTTVHDKMLAKTGHSIVSHKRFGPHMDNIHTITVQITRQYINHMQLFKFTHNMVCLPHRMHHDQWPWVAQSLVHPVLIALVVKILSPSLHAEAASHFSVCHTKRSYFSLPHDCTLHFIHYSTELQSNSQTGQQNFFYLSLTLKQHIEHTQIHKYAHKMVVSAKFFQLFMTVILILTATINDNIR